MINNMRSNLVLSQNFLSEDGAQEDDDSVGRAQRRHRLNAAKLVQLLSGSSGGVLREPELKSNHAILCHRIHKKKG